MIFFAHYSVLLTKIGWFSQTIQPEPYKVSVYCFEKPELSLTQYVHIKGTPLNTLTRSGLAKELKVSDRQVQSALKTFGVSESVAQQKVRELLVHKTTINQKCDSCGSHIVSEREAGQTISCSVCDKPMVSQHIIFGLEADYWNLGTTDLKTIVRYQVLTTPKKKLWSMLTALGLKPNRQTNTNILTDLIMSLFDFTDPKSYSFLYKLIKQVNDTRLRNN